MHYNFCRIHQTLRRTRYALALITAAGEVKALESKDKVFVSMVVDALNQAIIAA
jgi:Family of unknown function (DUF6232)